MIPHDTIQNPVQHSANGIGAIRCYSVAQRTSIPIYDNGTRVSSVYDVFSHLPVSTNSKVPVEKTGVSGYRIILVSM